MNDTDVLIVGAGPGGLFLANECARRGIRFRILEARSAQSEHSKALAIFPRTLEVFDMAGLAAPFLDAANRVVVVAVIAHGRPLARMRFEPGQTPYPFVAMVPQNVTERLLLDALRRRGGDVEYDSTFLSAEPTGNGVRVDYDQRGRRASLTAAFVAGCDGAHSAVRHQLHLAFEGGSYHDSFLLADVETNEALPADELQLCPNERGPLAIFPMSATRRRIVATIEAREGDTPSLDLVRRVLAERAPREAEALALHWSSYFRIHHRHVDSLRSGRFFVAGDAAHIHSPFGGQGMNTGLQDAWNLAWKLDLALRGHAGEALLDSYGAERLPVIRSVIAMTDLMTRAMGTPSRVAQALRDAIIPMVSRLAPFQHAFVERLSELDVAYGGSPIVEGPGRRYWDASLGAGGIRSRFMLMIGEEEDAATRAAAAALVERHPEVLESRPCRAPGVTLVRPDGYVATESSAGGPSAVDSARAVLERQTA